MSLHGVSFLEHGVAYIVLYILAVHRHVLVS